MFYLVVFQVLYLFCSPVGSNHVSLIENSMDHITIFAETKNYNNYLKYDISDTSVTCSKFYQSFSTHRVERDFKDHPVQTVKAYNVISNHFIDMMGNKNYPCSNFQTLAMKVSKTMMKIIPLITPDNIIIRPV